jgi:PAS domain S-box-containing protein
MRRDDLPEARILMVDDRPENLIALEAILEPLGHELVRAASGEEALRHVLIQDFAVILLDVQMPGMNGFETAQFIKTRERSRHTPIIFLTAISKDEAYVFEGYSAGAVDYLFKPFHPDILRSKVSVFVDLFLKSEELRRQEELLRLAERRELELRHRAELYQSEARFAHIVDSATDAIVTFDENRRVTLFNAAAERVFRVSVEDALHRPIDEFIVADAGFPKPDEEESASAPGEPPKATGSMEGIGLRGGGERFPIEYSVSTLEVDDETISTLIIRDITERRRAEELLRSQKESLESTTEELRTLNEELAEQSTELESAMGARARFYASMSHELRTPINAIMGYSSLLLDRIYGELNDKQISSVRRTHVAANHLLELVNDVLDLSKIEAGKLDLHFEPVTFPEVVQDLFVTVSPFAEEHGVDLTLGDCEREFTVVTDPRRLRQVVLNLLSNAIKFGGGNPVEVRCSESGERGAVIRVIDRGEGIAPEDQERIFEEFVQLEDGEAKAGTGLGLPISRRLAELLGGHLTCSSAPGEGSVFEFAIPLKPPDVSASQGLTNEGNGSLS